MNRFKIAVATAALLGAAVVPSVVASPASAAGDGCGSPRQKHSQSWYMDRKIQQQDIRLTAVTTYVYCPTDLFQNRKIKYWTITYCWTFINGSYNPANFSRVDFDTIYFNNNITKQLDPFTWTLNDQGGNLQYCMDLDLRFSSTGGGGNWWLGGNMVDQWWNMTSGPMWQQSATVWRTDGSYDNFAFTYGGNPNRAINPGADPEIGGWYRQLQPTV